MDLSILKEAGYFKDSDSALSDIYGSDWDRIINNKEVFSNIVKCCLNTEKYDNPIKIGLGTAGLDQDNEKNMVVLLLQAILEGYLFIDTAYSYGTEKIVGQALKILFDAGFPREKLFIQTKFYPVMPYDGNNLREQFKESLDNLGLDYVDSYLIHQPVPRYSELDYSERNISVWKEMELLLAEGKVKHIGVSNFLERHIIQITDNCDTAPEINQLEINPQFQQRGLSSFCKNKGMIVQGWGALSVTQDEVKDVLRTISEKYDVSMAQVALKWNLQMGNIPICSSKNICHLAENLKLDFELSDEDMEMIRNCNSPTAHRKTWWYPRQQMY